MVDVEKNIGPGGETADPIADVLAESANAIRAHMDDYFPRSLILNHATSQLMDVMNRHDEATYIDKHTAWNYYAAIVDDSINTEAGKYGRFSAASYHMGTIAALIHRAMIFKAAGGGQQYFGALISAYDYAAEVYGGNEDDLTDALLDEASGLLQYTPATPETILAGLEPGTEGEAIVREQLEMSGGSVLAGLVAVYRRAIEEGQDPFVALKRAGMVAE